MFLRSYNFFLFRCIWKFSNNLNWTSLFSDRCLSISVPFVSHKFTFVVKNQLTLMKFFLITFDQDIAIISKNFLLKYTFILHFIVITQNYKNSASWKWLIYTKEKDVRNKIKSYLCKNILKLLDIFTLQLVFLELCNSTINIMTTKFTVIQQQWKKSIKWLLLCFLQNKILIVHKYTITYEIEI